MILTEKLIAQIGFWLLSQLPVDKLMALAIQEFGEFAEKVIESAKARAAVTENKVDDAVVAALTKLFHSTIGLLDVPRLKKIMDFILDVFETSGKYLRTCAVIRKLFKIDDNDLIVEKVKAATVDDLPKEKFAKIFSGRNLEPYSGENGVRWAAPFRPTEGK